MLRQVADGVLVHESEFVQSNAVVVQGTAGVLLIDAGITDAEMAGMANDISALGQPVAAGFSTHPHWDHVLWHAALGATPRYGTARCRAYIQAFLGSANWKDDVTETLPLEVAGLMSLDEFGLIAGLPADSAHIPWDGATVRIIEHQGHAPGHAALLMEEARVLVVGDMLSDILIPMLDFEGADPIEDYLSGLRLLESAADNVDVFVPGHGSVGGADELRSRATLDRAYVNALRDGTDPGDPRIGPMARAGWEWVSDVHAGQLEQLSQWKERTSRPITADRTSSDQT